MRSFLHGGAFTETSFHASTVAYFYTFHLLQTFENSKSQLYHWGLSPPRIVCSFVTIANHVEWKHRVQWSVKLPFQMHQIRECNVQVLQNQRRMLKGAFEFNFPILTRGMGSSSMQSLLSFNQHLSCIATVIMIFCIVMVLITNR